MSNKEIRVLKGCGLWILRGGLTVLWSEGISSAFGVLVFDFSRCCVLCAVVSLLLASNIIERMDAASIYRQSATFHK